MPKWEIILSDTIVYINSLNANLSYTWSLKKGEGNERNHPVWAIIGVPYHPRVCVGEGVAGGGGWGLGGVSGANADFKVMKILSIL